MAIKSEIADFGYHPLLLKVRLAIDDTANVAQVLVNGNALWSVVKWERHAIALSV